MSSSTVDPARTGATLERSMSPFSSFAISMSTICILAGGITSFHVGLCSVGGAAIGIGWPIECLFALIVAMCLAHLASAFPTAGGTYHWSYTLGGRGWGWFTAFLSLAGLITALAAVNVGLCHFVIRAVSRVLEFEPENVHPWIQRLAVLAITFVQAYVNHRGIKLTSKLNDFSGYWIMAVAAFVIVEMLIAALLTGFDLGRLFEFVNNSNRPLGEERVHDAAGIPWLFAMGLLLPAYTLTGFDSAAQTSEETVDAPRVVPRGIVRAVLVSGIVGWIMLSSIVLAAPNLDVAASKGENSFFHIIRESELPYWTHSVTYIGLGVGMFLCGFAIVTSASRMAFAFARDGGLPFSPYLQRISPSHHTPSIAIWTVAGAALLFACTPTYSAIASACAIFLCLSYVLPVAAGFFAYGRTWTRMGPWQLGRAFRPLAAVSVAGCLILIFIGMQPRNEAARWVVGGTLAVLACLWFFYKRQRFPGPPEEVHRQLLLTESSASENKAQKENSMSIENAYAVLQHIPLLKGKTVVITELGGGMTNKIYKIEDGNEAHVLRVFGQGTDILGIDREREVACSKAIAVAGLGAEVVAYLPELNPLPFPEFCGALLVGFLPGKLLKAEDVHADMLRRIGTTLKACHAAPIDGVAEFSVFRVIPDYLRKSRERNVDLPAAWGDALVCLQRIENELATNEPQCLCHNDLLAGNFLDDDKSLRIIDWEYGGRGNRYFDLGNFATNMQLSDEQEQVVLQAYFGEVRDADVRRVKLMRIASDLREASWGFLQHAISKLGPPKNYESYHGYGKAHLDRALAAAKSLNL